MKIALLHDLLVKLGGAEKVLEKLANMYPNAPIYTLMYDEEKVGNVFPKHRIITAKTTQNVYQLTRNQRFCLPFMAKSVESFDLSEYDVVIASHSAFVHGAITKPETKFIVYYHTPARYMWDRTNEYKKEIKWNTGIKRWILNTVLHRLRLWDYQASQRHDMTLANSYNVAKRLKKYYHLDAEVVYPNVDVRSFQEPNTASYELPFANYSLIISALTEFKRIELAVQSFVQMPEKNLVIVGDGNYRATLEMLVPPTSTNILFVGRKPQEELIYLLQNAKSLIFCGEEDFGIVPIESFASGVPVFAYYGGGLKETMIPKVTGAFFYDRHGADFVSRFLTFDREVGLSKYPYEKIIEHAQNFREECFEKAIRERVEKE